MKIILLAAALALAFNAAIAAPATDAQIDVVTMPEPQLRAILAAALFADKKTGMGFSALGVDDACKIVRPAFEASVARHLPVWRAALLRAYRAKIPSGVLEQVVAAGPSDTLLVKPYVDALSADVLQASGPTLRQALNDVSAVLLAAASTIDLSTLDTAARRRELDAALEAGTLGCGLPGLVRKPE